MSGCLIGLASAAIVAAPAANRNERPMSEIARKGPLSAESALSVRDAAVAIRYHGVEYLPVVDDGRLVGIVAVREQPRRGRRRSNRRSDRRDGDGTSATQR